MKTNSRARRFDFEVAPLGRRSKLRAMPTLVVGLALLGCFSFSGWVVAAVGGSSTESISGSSARSISGSSARGYEIVAGDINFAGTVTAEDAALGIIYVSGIGVYIGDAEISGNVSIGSTIFVSGIYVGDSEGGDLVFADLVTSDNTQYEIGRDGLMSISGSSIR